MSRQSSTIVSDKSRLGRLTVQEISATHAAIFSLNHHTENQSDTIQSSGGFRVLWIYITKDLIEWDDSPGVNKINLSENGRK